MPVIITLPLTFDNSFMAETKLLSKVFLINFIPLISIFNTSIADFIIVVDDDFIFKMNVRKYHFPIL